MNSHQFKAKQSCVGSFLSDTGVSTLLAVAVLFAVDLNAQNTDSPLDAWSWRMPHPQGQNLVTSSYGNGVYLAAGEGDRVVRSTNGTDWTDHEISVFQNFSPSGGRVSSVSYGNGRWLAFTRSGLNHEIIVAATSRDGVTWSNSASYSFIWNLYSVAGGPQGFVAVGSPAAPRFSADGLNWEDVTFTPTLPDEFFGSVLAANGRFLLVNLKGLWWSEDGRNFVSVGTNFLRSGVRLAWGNGQYVALGTEEKAPYISRLYTSPDGVDWTERYASSNAPTLSQLTYGNGRFRAGMSSTSFETLISTDGIVWSTEISNIPGHEYSGPAGGHAGFARFGRSGNILFSSDGVQWEWRSDATRNNFRAIAHHDGLHVAVGNEGKLVTSIEGVDWTVRDSNAAGDLRCVAKGNGLWVAAGAAGSLITSTNGIDWATNGMLAELYAIAFADGQFVAVGDGAQIWRSLDGLVWQNVYEGLGDLYRLHGVTHGSHGWVATGRSFLSPEFPPVATSLLMTSSNAIHWVPQPLFASTYLESVAYGKGVYVAVGTPPAILTSTNGLDWMDTTPSTVRRTTSSEMNWVTIGNGTFVAVGEDGLILSSYDGWNWTHRYSGFGSRNLRSVVYADGVFTAVGNNDSILQSGNVLPRLTGLKQSNGFQVTVRGETNRTYQIESSANLEAWRNGGKVTNLNFTANWIDSNETNVLVRFYRARPD